MREIKLELVRHGPPHNQLLSPLTAYLALCHNHPPVTVHVPFEHNQFLHRLHSLHYKGDVAAREFELVDMGRAVGDLLGQIPGLIAELSKEGKQGVQLRLILSSSELALLPFELAFATEGMPGAGQPLLLQSEVPICLTREVRRSGSGAEGRGGARDRGRAERYSGEPAGRAARILFAWAAPRGYEEVPHEAHLLALTEALDPWANWRTSAPEGNPTIKVLPRASVQDVEAECRTKWYSHVHILAHGDVTTIGLDREYGLVLHREGSRDDEADIVLGSRLAPALSPSSDSNAAIARPVAVSIASCYGSARGSIGSAAGSSVAHALHVAGVPLVMASQFPLSHAASIRMVEILYESLLWGRDPRLSITNLRRSLQAELPHTHDWAAISAYVALDSDFETMQPLARVEPIADVVDQLMGGEAPEQGLQDAGTRKLRLAQLGRRLYETSDDLFSRQLDEVPQRDRPLVERQAARLNWSRGRLQEAEVGAPPQDWQADGEYLGHLKEMLPQIRESYWAAVTWDRASASPIAHYLWLDCLCRAASMANGTTCAADLDAPEGADQDERDADELWAAAHSSALYWRRTSRAGDALVDLILLQAVRLAPPHRQAHRTRDLARGYARELIKAWPPLASSVGQYVSRYARWYGLLTRTAHAARVGANPPDRKGALDLAERAALFLVQVNEVLRVLGQKEIPDLVLETEAPAAPAAHPRKRSKHPRPAS